MTRKSVEILIHLLLLMVAGWYLYESFKLAKDSNMGFVVSPGGFPAAIGILMVTALTVSLIKTARTDGDSDKFKIDNANKIVAIGTSTIVAVLLWSVFPSLVYLWLCLLFATASLIIRSPKRKGWKRDVTVACGVAAANTLVIYLVFALAFGISLG